MSSSWIPTWVSVAWVMVFAAVLLVHCRHAVALTGRARAWHGTHILMSAGMIVMFWPSDSMVVAPRAGTVVFAVAAVLVLAAGGLDRARNGVEPWVWLIAAVDLGAMAYMFAMMSTRSEPLTLVLVVWFLVETAGWATGSLLGLLQALEGTRLAAPALETVPPGVSGSPSARDRGPHEGHHRDLRVTLAAMSLGMAYMFLAMQYGMGQYGMGGM